MPHLADLIQRQEQDRRRARRGIWIALVFALAFLAFCFTLR